jgi:23S rRNA (uracil1939-C5)-methyltransferase
MLTVGSTFQGKAIDVDYLGQGIVKHEELVIFVKGLLEGETALIEIKTLKKRFAEGFVVDLIEASNMRKEGVENTLGSMDLYHMKDDAQLLWQKKLTQNTLSKVGGLDVEVEDIITDRHFTNYRNKSVFHVMFKNQLTLGLYHEDGRGLIPFQSFLLTDEITNLIIKHIQQKRINIDPSILKGISIRTNQKKEALVTLIATKTTFKGLTQLVQAFKMMPPVIGVTLNIKDEKRKILGSTSHVLFGSEVIEQHIGNLSFPVTDQSFFQINVPVATLAYDIIKQNVDPDSAVIDAYSGVGSIGFYLADKVKHVTLIETNEDAIKMANQVKETSHFKHVDVVMGRAEEEVQKHDADVLVVDPPRNGLMPALIQAMLERPFQQVFYLSCDLKTLSRDLGLLKASYDIKKVYPIRMFPQTTECETLVILSQK